MLDHLVELLDRLVDLGRAAVLLLARGGDLLHQFGGALDIRKHAVEHLSGGLGHLYARRGELGDLGRRLLRALGQLSHLACHHGKPLAVLPGAGRLYRCVQRQKVRLPRDLLYDGDLPGDVLHRLHRLGDRLPPFQGVLCGLHGDLFGLHGVVRVLPDVGGHLFHGGRGFFRCGRLLARPLGELLRPGRHLLAAACHVVGRLLHVGDHRGKLRHHAGEGTHQLVVGGTLLELHGQVAAGHLLGRARDRGDGGDQLVQVFLDLVEVAAVLLAYRRGHVPLGDAVDVVGGHLQRADHRVEGLVHPFDDAPEIPFVAPRVGAGPELSFHRGMGEGLGVVDERLDALRHPLERCEQLAGLVLGIGVEVHVQVSRRDLVRRVERPAKRPGDGVGHQGGEDEGERGAQDAAPHEDRLGPRLERLGVLHAHGKERHLLLLHVGQDDAHRVHELFSLGLLHRPHHLLHAGPAAGLPPEGDEGLHVDLQPVLLGLEQFRQTLLLLRIVRGEPLRLLPCLGEIGLPGVQRLEKFILAGEGEAPFPGFYVHQCGQYVPDLLRHLVGVDVHPVGLAERGEVYVSHRDQRGDKHDDYGKDEVQLLTDLHILEKAHIFLLSFHAGQRGVMRHGRKRVRRHEGRARLRRPNSTPASPGSMQTGIVS